MTAMDTVGWQAAWGINAAVAAVGITFALLFLPRATDEPVAR